MTKAKQPTTLMFIDIETTGLQFDSRLLEIAAVFVRAKDLQKIADFHVLVKPNATVEDADVWDAYVVDMHSKNGLLADIAKKSSTLEEALKAFGDWIRKLGLPAKSCYIAGSSVQTDIRKLQELDGEFGHLDLDGFSHRIVDLSTLRTFNKLAGGDLFPEKKGDETHRGMSDCLTDIEQLKGAIAGLKFLGQPSFALASASESPAKAPKKTKG